MKTLQTGILMTVLSAILILLGKHFGNAGMIMMLGLSLLLNVGSYYYSDKIVLAMYGAKPIEPNQAPELYNIVQSLCLRAEIPMPKLYVLPEQQPNAFATGRDPEHAAVAVTQGLLNVCDNREVKGVIAHELSHVKNRDTLLMTIVASIASAIMMLVNIIKWTAIFGGSGRDRDDNNPIAVIGVIILAPIAAMIVQLAISRQREYLADETGAKIAGDPMGLADALVKIEHVALRQNVGYGTPATAHMFISNPLKSEGMMSLFSTHPTTKQRVEKLRQMAAREPMYL